MKFTLHTAGMARALPILSVLLLSACANMSGVGGATEYSCKAPKGVQCDSVSGNYFNAIQNNLPAQRRQRGATATARDGVALVVRGPDGAPTPLDTQGATGRPLAGVTAMSAGGESLRSQARVLRLWFKPWEDLDHDLYDQGYVYVQIDGGNWLIDHAQQRIRDAYAPIRPPRPSGTRASAPDKTRYPGAGGPNGTGSTDGNANPVAAPFPSPAQAMPGPSGPGEERQ
jgi:conjugal transfer pilus assembly protein TraV